MQECPREPWKPGNASQFSRLYELHPGLAAVEVSGGSGTLLLLVAMACDGSLLLLNRWGPLLVGTMACRTDLGELWSQQVPQRGLRLNRFQTERSPSGRSCLCANKRG